LISARFGFFATMNKLQIERKQLGLLDKVCGEQEAIIAFEVVHAIKHNHSRSYVSNYYYDERDAYYLFNNEPYEYTEEMQYREILESRVPEGMLEIIMDAIYAIRSGYFEYSMDNFELLKMALYASGFARYWRGVLLGKAPHCQDTEKILQVEDPEIAVAYDLVKSRNDRVVREYNESEALPVGTESINENQFSDVDHMTLITSDIASEAKDNVTPYVTLSTMSMIVRTEINMVRKRYVISRFGDGTRDYGTVILDMMLDEMNWDSLYMLLSCINKFFSDKYRDRFKDIEKEYTAAVNKLSSIRNVASKSQMRLYIEMGMDAVMIKNYLMSYDSRLLALYNTHRFLAAYLVYRDHKLANLLLTFRKNGEFYGMCPCCFKELMKIYRFKFYGQTVNRNDYRSMGVCRQPIDLKSKSIQKAVENAVALSRRSGRIKIQDSRLLLADDDTRYVSGLHCYIKNVTTHFKRPRRMHRFISVMGDDIVEV